MDPDIQTIYGALKTTTFTTSVAFAASPMTSAALWPDPPVRSTVQFISLPSPTNSLSKWYPEPLPVLVLTLVDVVSFDLVGEAITTSTMLQSVPAHAYVVMTSFPSEKGCNTNKWYYWSAGKRAGIIIAAMVVTVIFLGLFGCCCRCLIRKGKEIRDEEQGTQKMKTKGERVRNGKSRHRKKKHNDCKRSRPGSSSEEYPPIGPLSSSIRAPLASRRVIRIINTGDGRKQVIEELRYLRNPSSISRAMGEIDVHQRVPSRGRARFRGSPPSRATLMRDTSRPYRRRIPLSRRNPILREPRGYISSTKIRGRRSSVSPPDGIET